MQQPLLQMVGISCSFPGVKALDNVDFAVLRRGEVHALLGENGAGKSTLMKILAGVQHKNAGRIIFQGTRILERVNPQEATKAGISMIFQEFSLFPQLSVAENIYLPLTGKQPIQKQKMTRLAVESLEKLNAQISPTALVKDLTVAEQQMVEIAKALSRKTNLIIMDEPTSALSDKETQVLFDIIKTLSQQEIGIILITHRLNEIMAVAEKVTVLRDGKLIGTTDVSKVTVDELVQMMVGRKLDDSIRSSVSPGETFLEVKNFTKKGEFNNISFKVHQGEILGVAGLLGSGRTEVAKAVFGVNHKDKGELLIKGQKVVISSPIEAIRNKIAFLTEDRKREGLVLDMSVSSNITLPIVKKISHFKFLKSNEEKRISELYLKELNIRPNSTTNQAKQLSGGNQQKVVLGKWLASDPDILIIDEPTRGIDIGAKMEIYLLLRKLADGGKAILMISSDLPEILKLSDRILVMHEGCITGEFLRNEATEEKIMLCATGQSCRG